MLRWLHRTELALRGLAVPPPAVFLHVFKTGGTSIANWLYQHYPVSAAPPDAVSFLGAPARYDAPLVAGHLALDDALRLAGRRFLVTVLREPEAQLMSALWHLASAGGDRRRLRPAELADVLARQAERCRATGAAMQSVFFAAPGRLEDAPGRLGAFDVVGLTERLDDTMRLIAWRLWLAAPRRSPHMRSSGAGGTAMPDELRAILAGHLRLDSALYEAGRRRFEADFAELCTAAGSRADIDAFLDARARHRPLLSVRAKAAIARRINRTRRMQ